MAAAPQMGIGAQLHPDKQEQRLSARMPFVTKHGRRSNFWCYRGGWGRGAEGGVKRRRTRSDDNKEQWGEGRGERKFVFPASMKLLFPLLSFNFIPRTKIFTVLPYLGKHNISSSFFFTLYSFTNTSIFYVFFLAELFFSFTLIFHFVCHSYIFAVPLYFSYFSSTLLYLFFPPPPPSSSFSSFLTAVQSSTSF